MSVAFRRDSDEEHREPRFEIPVPSGPNLVTPAGLVQAQERVAELEAAVEAEADETSRAVLQRDLRYWRTRLATAEVPPAPDSSVVSFGSRVRFRLKGQLRVIDIVGDDEADPANARISFSAPLARAMMGAAVDDLADFGGVADAIEIIEISSIEWDRAVR